MTPRPSRLSSRVLVLIGLLGTVALASAALRMRSLRARGAELSERLDRAIAEHGERVTSGKVWTPRPLRGDPLDENGLVLQEQAIGSADIPANTLRNAKSGCFEPTAEAADFAAHHRGVLEDLRRAARATSAWPADGADLLAPLGTTLRVLQAQRALLVLALQSPADECLLIAADDARLAQQLAPGAGLRGLMASGAQQVNAAFAMLGCAPAASPEALGRAAREALLLAEDAPSIGAGDTLEVEYLFMSSMARSIPISSHVLPRDGADLTFLMQGGRFMDVSELMLADVDEARDIGAAGHPRAAARWEALDARHRSRFPVEVGVETVRYAARDQAVQATLRAVATLLAALAADAASTAPQIPPLTDPFDAQPLRLVRAANAPPAVWSSGPNGRDDGGAGDDLVFEAPTARAYCPKQAGFE